jgi:hypothetical protein
VLRQIRRYLIIAVLLAMGYFLASQHIIIDKKDFSLLKKSYLTFEYTFYNITDKDPEDVMAIDLLRDAGIGDLLEDWGLLTELERETLETKYEEEIE